MPLLLSPIIDATFNQLYQIKPFLTDNNYKEIDLGMQEQCQLIVRKKTE